VDGPAPKQVASSGKLELHSCLCSTKDILMKGRQPQITEARILHIFKCATATHKLSVCSHSKGWYFTPPLVMMIAMMAAASITHDKGFHMNPRNLRNLDSCTQEKTNACEHKNTILLSEDEDSQVFLFFSKFWTSASILRRRS
jgi:hypothetical protein